MHIHILGICGTFMGGIAAIAKEAGHTVTGCDANVYPPMSTQLEQLGIHLTQGFADDQISDDIDLYVIGNAISRGKFPLMEAIMDRGLPYVSGPEWLAKHVLQDKWVLAVAGTHGKTTTSSMLAWILEYAGLAPGFLIGGVPENFSQSARLPQVPANDPDSISPFFVIEADEYDTAFFDKRSKFVHYHPRTAILNNLEFDHADIFADLAQIETQFHHLVRTVPSQGLLVVNGQEASLERVLARGCWSSVEKFADAAAWHVGQVHEDGGFEVFCADEYIGTVHWGLMGEHNRNNAVAAIAAARHAGVTPVVAIEALAQFQNVKRRMEVKGVVNQVTVYDDFAHHPTAIETTVAGLRAACPTGRILAVLEPRSNTMKLGTMKQALPASLKEADHVFCYAHGLDWSAEEALAPMGEQAETWHDLDGMVDAIVKQAQAGDHILVMSNGGFGGVHQKLLDALQAS